MRLPVAREGMIAAREGMIETKFSVKLSLHNYDTYRGGAANFGFISITYHQYIFGLYKYILRLEISIFDRKNR